MLQKSRMVDLFIYRKLLEVYLYFTETRMVDLFIDSY